MCRLVLVLVVLVVAGVRGEVEYDVYHNFEALETFMNQTAKDYPDITHLYSIGQSVQGRDLWVMALAAQDPDKHVLRRPEVQYVGNMHGNEVVGREFMIYLIDHLASGFGQDDRVTMLLKTTRVHIMVSMNPDGFEKSTLEGQEGMCNVSHVSGRFNSNGYNLNRNFPDHFMKNPDPIQPETQAVMDWFKDIQFSLHVNFHGGALVVVYGWDSYKNADEIGEARYSRTPDDDIIRTLALTYSTAHPTMSSGQRFCDAEYAPSKLQKFDMGITNGAKWYPVTGGMQDYCYIHGSCLPFLVEVSCCKYPNRTELLGFWQDHKEPMLRVLERMNWSGVRGIVTDDEGLPVHKAHLYVEDRKFPGFYTTKDGEFWRILNPGSYKLTVVTETLQTKTVEFMTHDRYTVLNIQLEGRKPSTQGSGQDGNTMQCCHLVVMVVTIISILITSVHNKYM